MTAMKATALADLGLAYQRSLVDGECSSGKCRYPDQGTAARALELAQLSDSRWRREQDFYPCPDCGGFHLTSHISTWAL
jgi:hypothetical protein